MVRLAKDVGGLSRWKTALALAVMSGFIATHSHAADQDGCWSGYHPDGGSCVDLDSDFDGHRQHMKFSNRCDQRIYLTWCTEEECGTEALRPGQWKSKYAYTISWLS